MTTVYPVEQTCANCGDVSTHYAIGSTNTMGPSDLDLRPAPMARWTLETQVQRCPRCGYCSADISEATDAARGVVANEAYQEELRHAGYPELTRRYVCASLVLSVEGEDAAAGRAALNGAWAADDAADTLEMAVTEAAGGHVLAAAEAVEAARAAAAHCRRMAIGCFEADRRKGLTFAADDDTADALLADLHRRVGDFDAARACVGACLGRDVQGFLRQVLEFQSLLIEARDTGCHNTGEVRGDDDAFLPLDAHGDWE